GHASSGWLEDVGAIDSDAVERDADRRRALEPELVFLGAHGDTDGVSRNADEGVRSRAAEAGAAGEDRVEPREATVRDVLLLSVETEPGVVRDERRADGHEIAAGAGFGGREGS